MPVVNAQQGFGVSRSALEVGGRFAGFLNSVEGGSAYSDVVEDKVGVDNIVHKHIAGVKYDNITITCGTGMTAAVYGAIKEMCNGNTFRFDSAIQSLDFDGNIVSLLQIMQGTLTEVGFPALDASSKDAARLTVKITPESTRRKMGSGKLQVATKPAEKWLCSNFRLTIPGLDCKTVYKIGALTIKQQVTAATVGQQRISQQQPSVLEVPNLVVTLAESHAQSFYDWHEDFVINGHNGADKLKQATLELLTPDLKEALFTLTFHDLGIFRLDTANPEAGGENIRRVKAQMYCDRIDFVYAKDATLD